MKNLRVQRNIFEVDLGISMDVVPPTFSAWEDFGHVIGLTRVDVALFGTGELFELGKDSNERLCGMVTDPMMTDVFWLGLWYLEFLSLSCFRDTADWTHPHHQILRT